MFTASSNHAPTTASKRQLSDNIADDCHTRNADKRHKSSGNADDLHHAKSPRDNKKPESSSDSGTSSVFDLDSFCSSYYNLQRYDDDAHSSYVNYQVFHEHTPLPKIPRRERYKTITPLYKKFLKRRLLSETNVWFHPCCWNECSGKWSRKRPSVKQMMKDYHPSDLSVTQYSWGQWRQTHP